MADHRRSDRVHRGNRVWDDSNVEPDTAHIKNPRQREREIVRILDDIGFNYTVWIAVSAGFLASSYTIFSSNIIGPALQYVYPTGPGGHDDFGEPGLTIDMVTVGTTTLGMLVFGHLADRLGRKKLYGIELFIIILGTVGMIQSSNGYSNEDGKHSLNIYASVAAWRGIQGLGIGAEAGHMSNLRRVFTNSKQYPLSAVIAAEFSSTETRGTLMASMFAMQSVGRLLAYLVELGALSPLSDDGSDHRIAIDKIWRLVVGISAIPALLAIGLRLTIPETPRYYTGVEKDLTKAVRAAERVGGKPHDIESIHSDIQPTRTNKARPQATTSWQSSAWDYLFGKEKAWKRLLGISLLWFLLDVAFFGMGLDSPSTLHRLWLDEKPQEFVNCTRVYKNEASATSFATATLTMEDGVMTTLTQVIATPVSTVTTALVAAATARPDWNEDDGDVCATISESLESTAVRTLLLTSIASVLGSMAAIFVINRFSRRHLLAFTSGVLCLLFFASGFAVWKATETPVNEVSMVLFALTQFMFNLGPNTLTFIIAAESFPTIFRGSFHGFAAASGKLGALLIRPIMHSIGRDKDSLRNVLFAFCGVMLLMVIISLIPSAMVDVQFPRHELQGGKRESLARAERGWCWIIPTRLRNKTLEQISPNPESWLEGLMRDGQRESVSNEGKAIGTQESTLQRYER